ncbi:M28 family peptidase [Thermogemmatispora onikobensis]|uniref:M28 family peptidase n=1 Tax=Thermogemmatispora onikobensis TaxID=732234 RepID=UPI000853A52E|nr:M28 family peptidase [Thermogemmatispora onikobensis]
MRLPDKRPRWQPLARKTTLVQRLLLSLFLISLLCSGSYEPLSVSAGGRGLRVTSFPTVDGNYIYQQLSYMATHFLKREAGYDRNLPPSVNGHDEFAAYWSAEMQRNLSGFDPQVQRDPFAIQGWLNRPAVVPAFNVEVSVPGIDHPEQIIIIGCHYDGMAFSTQSAYDDASGCAIELGIARGLASYWREHQLYPARTLRFVLFDAEEQGLYGSFHAVNETMNADLENIIAMFNEEQSGIAYPVRYLGQAANPVFPLYVDLSPLTSNKLYPQQSDLPAEQRQRISQLRSLMDQAVPAVFAELYEEGYQMLSYHGRQQQDIFEPIFTPDQQQEVIREDDRLGSSDQVPFTLAGLACATLVGNSSYYSTAATPGYPFDQPEDTIQLMNTFADGSAQQSQALTLALTLPAMLTTWLLNQPAILGAAPADGRPLTAIGDLSRALAGHSLVFEAQTALLPGSRSPVTGFSYRWDFGDGQSAQGQRVSHIYRRAGEYQLRLTVTAPTGAQRLISKRLVVGQQSPGYLNPYARSLDNGTPPGNPGITLPKPNNQLSDRVTTVAQATAITEAPSAATTHPVALVFGVAISLALLFVILIGVLLFISRSQRNDRQNASAHATREHGPGGSS